MYVQYNVLYIYMYYAYSIMNPCIYHIVSKTTRPYILSTPPFLYFIEFYEPIASQILQYLFLKDNT